MRCSRCPFRAAPDVLRLFSCAECSRRRESVCPCAWSAASPHAGFCGVCGDPKAAGELVETVHFLCHACSNMFRDMVKGRTTQRYVREALWGGTWREGDMGFVCRTLALEACDPTFVEGAYDPRTKRAHRADFVATLGGEVIFRVEVKSGPGRPGEGMREFQLDASDYHALREASRLSQRPTPVLVVHVQRELDASRLPTLGWKCSGAWAVWAHDLGRHACGYRKRACGGASASSAGTKLALMFSASMFRDVSSSLPLELMAPVLAWAWHQRCIPSLMPCTPADIVNARCCAMTARGVRCGRSVATWHAGMGEGEAVLCSAHCPEARRQKRRRQEAEGGVVAATCCEEALETNE